MGREPGPPLPASSSSSPWPDCPCCVVSVAPRLAHPSPTPLAPQRLLSVSVLVTPGFLHGVPISHVRDIARGCPHSQKHPLPLRGARLASQRGHRLCPPPGPEASGLQPLRGVMNPARLAPAGFVAPATPEGAEPPEPRLCKPRSPGAKRGPVGHSDARAQVPEKQRRVPEARAPASRAHPSVWDRLTVTPP